MQHTQEKSVEKERETKHYPTGSKHGVRTPPQAGSKKNWTDENHISCSVRTPHLEQLQYKYIAPGTPAVYVQRIRNSCSLCVQHSVVNCSVRTLHLHLRLQDMDNTQLQRTYIALGYHTFINCSVRTPGGYGQQTAAVYVRHTFINCSVRTPGGHGQHTAAVYVHRISVSHVHQLLCTSTAASSTVRTPHLRYVHRTFVNCHVHPSHLCELQCTRTPHLGVYVHPVDKWKRRYPKESDVPWAQIPSPRA